MEAPQELVKNGYGIWYAVILAIGGVAALWVRYKFYSGQQRRRECRSIADEIITQVEKISSLCVQYYSLNGGDAKCEGIASEIRSSLRQLGLRVNLLHQKFVQRSLLSLLWRFRQQVSLDLDRRIRNAIPSHDQKYADIANAGEKLVLEVEKTFSDKFD